MSQSKTTSPIAGIPIAAEQRYPARVRSAPDVATADAGTRASNARPSNALLLGAFVVLWLGITLVRFEVIDSPPYYDYAMGLWSEADFLADTGFDYYRLRFQERHTFDMEGGRRSYMTSVMPTLVAALMVALPTPRGPLIAYHLFIFACTAGVIVMLFVMLASLASHRSRQTAMAAGVGCLATLTTPIFATQIDMASMEMPLILCVMLTVWLAGRHRYKLAAAMSLACFFVKATGIVVTLAVLTHLSCMLWLGRPFASVTKRRQLRRALWFTLAILATEWIVIRAGNSFGEQVHPVAGSFWRLCQYWFPDLLFVCLVALTLTLASVAIWWRRATRAGDRRPAGDRLREYLWRGFEARPQLMIAMIIVTGMIAAVHVVFFVPRYAAMIVPLVYLLIGSGWLALRNRPDPAAFRAVGIGLLCVISVNLWNWNGALYLDHRVAQLDIHGPFGVWLGREHSHFERSHEYLAEHRANQHAVALLAQTADAPVFAGHPYNYFLTLPRLGYAEQPVRGYSSVGYANADDCLVDVDQLLKEQPKEGIFLWAANGFSMALSKFRIPLPFPGDTTLFHDGARTPLIAYKKQFSFDSSSADDLAEKRWWYLSNLWPNLPGWTRIGRFIRAGQVDHALGELFEKPHETRPHLGFLYAALLVQLDRDDEAETRLMRAVAGLSTDDPMYEDVIYDDTDSADVTRDSRTSMFDRAVSLLEANDVESALKVFRQYSEAELSNLHRAMQSYRLARRAIDRGAAGEARRGFEATIAVRPDFAAAHNGLGEVLLLGGETSQAESAFQRAIDTDPEFVQPQIGLAAALARQGRFDEAADHLRRATKIAPENGDAIRRLAQLERLNRRGEQKKAKPRVGQTTFALGERSHRG